MNSDRSGKRAVRWLITVLVFVAGIVVGVVVHPMLPVKAQDSVKGMITKVKGFRFMKKKEDKNLGEEVKEDYQDYPV